MQDSHNEISEEITGVLLAGGKSIRMGRDKASIEVSGLTLAARSLDLLQRYFSKVVIAGDRPDLARPGVSVLPDIYPGSAMGGLYTALRSAPTDWIFVAPCDMPYPDSRILELLVARRHGYDAVVPKTPEGYEPVFAVYHKRCLPIMESMLKQGNYRIYAFYQRINICYLDWQAMPEGWRRSLLNVNTQEDLSHIKERQR
ncbi:MAG: molybdenum cofactor guanylyltransferase [Desulfuromonadales bacterium]|nr:molybdenum cofactor guanylyltransferase [Desulfuromonadales bacterium]